MGFPRFHVLAALAMGEWVFSLVPRPFQKDPRIDLAVITEMTDAGRKLRPPAADRPTYYLPQASGYHDEGQGIVGERPLPVEQLQARLEAALTGAHYLVADRRHPARLALFFAWGSDNQLDPETADIGHRNLLARAALVGGQQFAHDFEKALASQDELIDVGVMIGPKPVEQFMDRDARTRQLVEQSEADCFYVVVSAYDAGALAHGKRILLWRSKITANTDGVSMAETLPTLIHAGTPYFGRDMTEASTLTGHLIPEGTVHVGTPVEAPKR